jgi:hypothetical protein
MTEIAIPPTSTALRQRSFLKVSELFQVVLVFLVLAIFGSILPPDVNETHYLTKAKHYWDRDWCPNDIFLGSAAAHPAFYIAFGWITKFASLTVSAWIGRVVVWVLTAYAWQRLHFGVTGDSKLAPISAGIALVLLRHMHMAGEWWIGGVEAKSVAIIFMLLGLAEIFSGRWMFVWPYLGLASAFHVLIGGWTVLIAGLAWIFFGRKETSMAKNLVALLFGGALSLVGLIPGLLLDRGSSAEIIADAHNIYTFERLPHHLVFSMFTTERIVAFTVLSSFWLLFAIVNHRDRQAVRLHVMVAGSLLIAAGGIGIDQFSIAFGSKQVAADLLRFYWFRMSDLLVPMGVSLALLRWIALTTGLTQISALKGFAHRANFNPRKRTGVIVLVMLCTVLCFDGCRAVTDRARDPRSAALIADFPLDTKHPDETKRISNDWLTTCEWIRANTPSDAAFFTPTGQQTFKWFAERAEVCAWKDIPQDAQSMVEWRRRLTDVHPALQPFGTLSYANETLAQKSRSYKARYLIVDRGLLYQRWLREPLPYAVIFPENLRENQFVVIDLQTKTQNPR